MDASRRSPQITGALSNGVRLLIAVALVTFGLSAFVSSSGAQESSPTDHALVQFLHASPDAPSLDIYVDDSPVARGVEYGVLTGYLLIPEGSSSVRIVPADGNPEEQALEETDHEFDADSFYVVSIGGYLNDLETNLHSVDIDELDDATNARVRVINLVPDADDIDVYQVGGEALAEDINFESTSDYTDVPANTYELEVRTSEDGTVALTAPAYQVDANIAYDIAIIGLLSQETLEIRPIGTPTNQRCGPLLGIGTADDACVRIVHASPDAPSVDIYVGDAEQAAIAGLEFGMASDFISLAEGSHQIRVVPTGGTLDEPVIDTDIEVDAGQAYLVAATNTLEDIQTDVYEVDLSPIGGDQARVHAIHQVPGVDDVDVAASGTVIFEDLGNDDDTDSELLQAGTYDLEFRSAGDPAAIITSPGVTMEAGFVYDIMAIGSEEAGNLGILVIGSPAPSTASMGMVPVETSETPPATPGAEESPAA